MFGFLRKIVQEKDIFLLKINNKQFATVILAWVTRKQKNIQIRLIFWKGGIFGKLVDGGNFSKPIFFKGIYTTLILENEKNEKQKNLKTMK